MGKEVSAAVLGTQPQAVRLEYGPSKSGHVPARPPVLPLPLSSYAWCLVLGPRAPWMAPSTLLPPLPSAPQAA